MKTETDEETQSRRNTLAEILLTAVLESGVTDRGYPSGAPVTDRTLKVRGWLTQNPVADLYFRLLDINPTVACERLRRTWNAAAPHGGCTRHG
jgi:hypothetical protein